jgi:hypothetical protein
MSKRFEDRAANAIADLAVLEPEADLVGAARIASARESAATSRSTNAGRWILAVSLGLALALFVVMRPRQVGEPVAPADQHPMLLSGEVLLPGAIVETGPDSRTTLVMPGAGFVMLASSTRLRVGSGSSLELEHGLLTIDLTQSVATVDVAIAHTDEHVVVGDAAVGIAAANGHGALAVFAGVSSVIDPIRYEVIESGNVGLLQRTGSFPIADELRLDVDTPLLRQDDLHVTGMTQPGVLISIDQDDVTVDASGNFAASLRRDGRRSVTVQARDASGRERRHVVPLPVTPVKRSLGREHPIKTRWQWVR